MVMYHMNKNEREVVEWIEENFCDHEDEIIRNSSGCDFKIGDVGIEVKSSRNYRITRNQLYGDGKYDCIVIIVNSRGEIYISDIIYSINMVNVDGFIGTDGRKSDRCHYIEEISNIMGWGDNPRLYYEIDTPYIRKKGFNDLHSIIIDGNIKRESRVEMVKDISNVLMWDRGVEYMNTNNIHNKGYKSILDEVRMVKQ